MTITSLAAVGGVVEGVEVANDEPQPPTQDERILEAASQAESIMASAGVKGDDPRTQALLMHNILNQPQEEEEEEEEQEQPSTPVRTTNRVRMGGFNIVQTGYGGLSQNVASHINHQRPTF